mmetsp:Transcript_5768/g.16363  ORF Transcript_5768/g.16363 Transcript_5768/m.16363 type:complete len:267 (+) Transcript_5768:1214-2014(+)
MWAGTQLLDLEASWLQVDRLVAWVSMGRWDTCRQCLGHSATGPCRPPPPWPSICWEAHQLTEEDPHTHQGTTASLRPHKAVAPWAARVAAACVAPAVLTAGEGGQWTEWCAGAGACCCSEGDVATDHHELPSACPRWEVVLVGRRATSEARIAMAGGLSPHHLHRPASPDTPDDGPGDHRPLPVGGGSSVVAVAAAAAAACVVGRGGACRIGRRGTAGRVRRPWRGDWRCRCGPEGWRPCRRQPRAVGISWRPSRGQSWPICRRIG